ncbi:Proteasome subunit alpha type-3 [Sparganum proliferum]
MSSIGTGYDLSASQFSPEGKVFQIETAVALKGKDGVVFAVENIVLSKLYEAGCTKRIYNIDTHIGMVVAGLQSDAKALVEIARDECSSYRENFGSAIPLKDGAHLYVVEPSGISYAYEGCAIGKAKQNAKTELEQLKLKDMTIQELIKEAAKM